MLFDCRVFCGESLALFLPFEMFVRTGLILLGADVLLDKIVLPACNGLLGGLSGFVAFTETFSDLPDVDTAELLAIHGLWMAGASEDLVAAKNEALMSGDREEKDLDLVAASGVLAFVNVAALVFGLCLSRDATMLALFRDTTMLALSRLLIEDCRQDLLSLQASAFAFFSPGIFESFLAPFVATVGSLLVTVSTSL